MLGSLDPVNGPSEPRGKTTPHRPGEVGLPLTNYFNY